jgi:hypothetical protein
LKGISPKTYGARLGRWEAASPSAAEAEAPNQRELTKLGEPMRSAQEKALDINLKGGRFGTFAEIGAGQEVVRWFFHAGKASSTVAKSISAYGKEVSDSLYGAATHYVSRERLEAMLDLEFRQLIQLDAARQDQSRFFVFADTMATHGSSKSSEGHGWLGIRFQNRPREEPSEVIIHIELMDAFNALRQEAVGLAGVNLIYSAFTSSQDPPALVRGLMEGLDRRRIEIDMIKFAGPLFRNVDHRLMALQLVEQGYTDAAMFTATGEVVQPSEILHGREVLIERGSFRPITNVTLKMLNAAERQLAQGAGRKSQDPVVLMEMTLKNLMSEEKIDHADFLARAEILGALNKNVLISNYTRFDCVIQYLRQYTQEPAGLVVGVPILRAILDESYYRDLDGGILEALGRLFQGPVKLFVYPTLSPNGNLQTADNLEFDSKQRDLYRYLQANGGIEPIREFDLAQLDIAPPGVLKMIRSGDPAWRDYVPPQAAELIQRQKLFGYRERTPAEG